MIHELRRQADEQPDMQKLLWKRQLSQQADYRAEIHELHTELLNMREKSKMKSHLAAHMCKIDQTVPSRTVESEPENVLNTLSLQAVVRDGFYLKNSRLRTGQLHRAYNHQLAIQFN